MLTIPYSLSSNHFRHVDKFIRAASSVANRRSNGNNLEMEKEWELMSEFDKDEFIHQKIIREL